MDESPFEVVIPKDRNMLSYLKKDAVVSSNSPRTDISSKSSITTETSFSTVTNLEDSGIFPPQVGRSLSNSKKSLLNSSCSSSDGSANFVAWGDLLDFSQQGFGDSFRDDILEKGFEKDRKAASLSKLGLGSIDPFGFEEHLPSRKPSKAFFVKNMNMSDDFDLVCSHDTMASLDQEFTFEAFAQTTDSDFQAATGVFGSDPFIVSPTSRKIEERRGTSKARHSRSPKVEQMKLRSSNDTGRSTGGSRGVICSEFPAMPRSPTLGLAGKKSSSSRRISDLISPRKDSERGSRPRDNGLVSQRSRSVPRSTSPRRTNRVPRTCRRASITSGDTISSFCVEETKPNLVSAENRARDRPRLRRGSVSHELFSGSTDTGSKAAIDSTKVPVLRNKSTPISGRTCTNTSKSPLLTRKKSVSGPAHRPAGGGVRRKRQTTPTTSPNMAVFRKGHFHQRDGKECEDSGCGQKLS